MSLDKHQLARLHAVLGPFMLRRVKADVIAEMVPKTEVCTQPVLAFNVNKARARPTKRHIVQRCTCSKCEAWR